MSKYDIVFNNEENDEIIKSYYFEGEDEPINVFPNFNKINIIVGANNSGKSRFMRNLMSKDSFVGVKDIKKTSKLISEYNVGVNNVNNGIDVFLERFNKRSYIQRTNGRDLEGDKAIMLQASKLKKLNGNDFKSIDNALIVNSQLFENLEEGNINFSELSKLEKELKNLSKDYDNIKRYYIPTLRTAHSLFTKDALNHKKIEQDIYLDTLNKYYDLDKIDLDVFTGIHLHKEILNTRNSKREIRQSFEKFEKFISKNFFSGKQIDIVAEFNKDESLQGFNYSEIISVHIQGEKDTRELSQLGDGIQAIIVLMYKIFMAEDNSIIFIDEPELNLHPGMQRLFLEQIYSNSELLSKNLRYVISTHSNHFLDLTLEKSDVSIFSFSPKYQDGNDKEFIIKNVNAGDNQILKHLGVNNSSVFLANCSLWVEGVSDRNYIKAFLKSYLIYLSNNKQAEFISIKEDIDYAFFEYAGSNIEHYVFEKEISNDEESLILKEINALALNNKIFLLADSDNAVEGDFKWERLKALEEINNENFSAKIIRELRESENLLINDIWEKVLIKFCNKKLLKKLEQEIEIKDKISQALTKVNSEDYKKEYIGKFLNKLSKQIGQIDGINILNQIFEKKGTTFGTLIPKRELSEYVLEADIEWGIFAKSKEIENLTIDVYNFIVNSRN